MRRAPLLLLALLPSLAAQEFEFAGDRIPILPHGGFGRRVPAAVSADPASVEVWRARCVIQTRTELVVPGSQVVRGELDAAEIARVRAEIARFAEKAQEATGGSIRLEPEILVAEGERRIVRRSGETIAPVPEAEETLGVSGKGVDSVFWFYAPGDADLALWGGTLPAPLGPDGVASSGIAILPQREKGGRTLADVLLHEWAHQLEGRLEARHGPGLPGIHDWALHGYRDEQLFLGDWLRWLGAQDHGWLDRRRTVADLAQRFARPGLRFTVEPGVVFAHWDGLGGAWRAHLRAEGDTSLDNQLTLERESVLLVPAGGEQDLYLALVRFDVVDLWTSVWRDAEPLGCLPLGGAAPVLAAFALRVPKLPGREVDLIDPELGRRRDLPVATIAVRAESGPRAVVRAGQPYVLEIENRDREPLAADLELWLPPEVQVLGAPARVQLAGGARTALPVQIQVEPDRPSGVCEIGLVLRAEPGKKPLAETKVQLQSAVGRDFLRLSFEGPPRSGPWLERRTDAEWKAEPRRLGAACGERYLALSDGGGTRHGAVWLFGATPAAGMSFDSEQFPHLTFFLRAKPAGRLALHLRVDGRDCAIPLLGQPQPRDGVQWLPAARFEADGNWQRVEYALDDALDKALAKGNHRVTRLGFGDPRLQRTNRQAGADGATYDLDEFAVVRTPDQTPADRLRDLCERWAANRDGADAAAIAAGFAAIAETDVTGQDRVDWWLLRHALAYQQATAALPRKRAGEPAGPELFAAMLRHQQMVEQSPEELLAIGWAAIREHQQALTDLAEKLAPGRSWREVVEMLKHKHPTAEQLPVVAERNWKEARDFTLAQALVTVPFAARHALVEAHTDGWLSKTYAFGGYGGARPSPSGFTGVFLVSPPAVWMTPEQKQERLRGNHYAWNRVVALHEVIPGHHLQTVVHEMRPLSPFRKRFYSTLFAEGWALYCEEMLYGAGYFGTDPELRFAQLQMRLWRATRVVMDCALQTGRIDKDAAQRLFVTEAALDPENAQAEVTRDIDAPTRPLSYFLGYRLIADLERECRARDGANFAARAFRDRVLAFGPVPLRAVRAGMGL